MHLRVVQHRLEAGLGVGLTAAPLHVLAERQLRPGVPEGAGHHQVLQEVGDPAAVLRVVAGAVGQREADTCGLQAFVDNGQQGDGLGRRPREGGGELVDSQSPTAAHHAVPQALAALTFTLSRRGRRPVAWLRFMSLSFVLSVLMGSRKARQMRTLEVTCQRTVDIRLASVNGRPELGHRSLYWLWVQV